MLHQRPELRITEEPREVLKADPDRGIGQDLVPGHEVLERDQHAVNREIVEQEDHQDRRKNHGQVRKILPEIPKPVPHGRLFLPFCNGRH